MGTVREILRSKGSQVFSIDRGETVYSAIEQMTRHNVGALVVTHDDAVCGIVTERDYLRKIALHGRSSHTTLVEEILSSPLVCVDIDATTESCLQTMTEKRCRHLPVRDAHGRGLVGIVSIGDCVKHVVREQQTEIENLHGFIHGSYR